LPMMSVSAMAYRLLPCARRTNEFFRLLPTGA
jgi:hypothetical protein